jgi:hypothetical protein
VMDCINSWTQHNPGYTIIEWNEENAPNHPIVTQNLRKKLWAFASDYVRLFAVESFGGFYLDTDIFLVKSLDSLLDHTCFVAFQYPQKNEYWITNGAIGAIKNHDFFKECIAMLEKHGHTKLTPYISPKLTTDILNLRKNNIEYGTQQIGDITVFDASYFYFYQGEDLNVGLEVLVQNLPEHSFGIHLYLGSWLNNARNMNFLEKMLLLIRRIKTKISLISKF